MRIVGILLIVGVLVMASILSLLAGAIGRFDFCAAVIAGCAVWLWAIAFQLARRYEQMRRSDPRTGGRIGS